MGIASFKDQKGAEDFGASMDFKSTAKTLK
jgi:hypothetical protein